MRTDLLTLYVFNLPTMSVPVGTWLQRMQTRERLRELDTRQLGDVGLSLAARQRECAKWFWQP